MIRHVIKSNDLRYNRVLENTVLRPWTGNSNSIYFDKDNIQRHINNLDKVLWIINAGNNIGVTHDGFFNSSSNESANNYSVLAVTQPINHTFFGDPTFYEDYKVQAAFYAGAMANAIASEEMVISLGKAGYMGSFGAAGLSIKRLEDAINAIKSSLPQGPYAFNLIHNPFDHAMEQKVVDIYLKNDITVIEAAAFLNLTSNIVAYKVSGLNCDENGNIISRNRIIAKISRKEVAAQFMIPAPDNLLSDLISQGRITKQQANLAKTVPVVDDITVEADSGGHTDNRPLVTLVPSIIALRNELQEKYKFTKPVRVGAGGGISTPESALAAYMLGAAYIVTGSINHPCNESGTCKHTKDLLSQADMSDVTMAPSADMFEMGVKVQVLKKGTLFPMRAQKLYDLYITYNSIDEIPVFEKEKLESKIFQCSLESVWEETISFFSDRDPGQIQRANQNPKLKMALIFRWYLGLSSRWSTNGEIGREMDYQIWCGPSMGSFNDWARGTYLEKPENRYVADITAHILRGCAYRYRIQNLQLQGIHLPSYMQYYKPQNS